MKPVELIYLSQEDIISLKMPMGEVIPIVENVFWPNIFVGASL